MIRVKFSTSHSLSFSPKRGLEKLLIVSENDRHSLFANKKSGPTARENNKMQEQNAGYKSV
jgi:hypothetical protein